MVTCDWPDRAIRPGFVVSDDGSGSPGGTVEVVELLVKRDPLHFHGPINHKSIQKVTSRTVYTVLYTVRSTQYIPFWCSDIPTY
jgi:hypothetical protein